MTTTPAAMNPPPPAPSFLRTLHGVWTLTVPRYFTLRHLLAFGFALLLLGLLCWAAVNTQARNHHDAVGYLVWSLGYFTFFLPLIAFVNAGGTLRDEMKPASTDYLLMRPVARASFVFCKYLCHLVGAEIEFLFAFALVAAFGLHFPSPAFSAAIPSLLLAQAIMIAAAVGFGFLCAAVTSRYIIVGLTYGAIVEVGIGQIPTELNRLSLTHQIKAMLQPYFAGPGFPLPTSLAGIAPASAGATVLMLLGFAAVTVIAAALLFSWREFSGANEP